MIKEVILIFVVRRYILLKNTTIVTIVTHSSLFEWKNRTKGRSAGGGAGAPPGSCVSMLSRVYIGMRTERKCEPACKNDAYVYVGKFVHCSAFAEAANGPCSQAVCSFWKPVIAECKKKMTSISKRIVCEFLLKYRHLADSIWLFAKRSSNSRMLFASPQEYVYIKCSHHFRMPHSHSNVNAALHLSSSVLKRCLFKFLKGQN